MEKFDMQSPNIVSENIEKIAALFPNCVTEGENGKVIDFDLLRQELSDEVVEGTKERYRLEWPGKRKAIVTANLPTTNTLRPVREDSVNFDSTENVYIEGDNLEILKILQESYLGKIKMIYIDPPYNTGKDFVYKDNFRKSTEDELQDSGQVDEYNQRLVANPDTAGRYHSDWLSMMYPRLKLARNLLTDDGVIFISIDDNEVHNLRKICDEVFGVENFRNSFTVRRHDKNLNRQFISEGLKTFNVGFEYVLCYSKTQNFLFNAVYKKASKDRQKNGYWKGFWNDADRPTMRYDILGFTPTKGQWKWKKETALTAVENYKKYESNFADKMSLEEYWIKTGKKLKFIRRNLSGKGKNKGVENWISPSDGILRNTNWLDFLATSLDSSTQNLFDYPKNLHLIKEFISTSDNNDSIILDFFSGSATTAHAVMQLNAEDGGNRKYIQVQIPEATDKKSEAYKVGYQNICEIGKERIRRAGKKIVVEQQAEVDKKKAALEKAINGRLTEVKGQYVFPEQVMIDETAEELLQELNDLRNSIDKLDIGFRVYRLDSSNMKDVYYRPQDITQDLFTEKELEENIKEDRSAEDLLTQVMLDWGLPLSLKIERVTIADKTVFKIAENSLYACFDKGIDEEFAKAIAKEKPLRIVFRDASFKDDTAKANVEQTIKQLSSEIEIKVI